MIRVLVAILATIGFLSVAPAVHATGSAMGGGAVAHDRTPSVMVSHSQVPCAGGSPCLHVCADCIPVLPGKADTAVLVESETKRSPGNLITFNLSWALYRPPKSGCTPRTTEIWKTKPT